VAAAARVRQWAGGFIKFPPSIAIGDQGQTELVNYRVARRYYIVGWLFGAAELRLGRKKQKVVRITRSHDEIPIFKHDQMFGHARDPRSGWPRSYVSTARKSAWISNGFYLTRQLSLGKLNIRGFLQVSEGGEGIQVAE